MNKASAIRSMICTWFMLGCAVLGAQELLLERLVNPFTVIDDIGIEYDMPFLGGLNTPIQQFADIDDDGDLDLFIQERDGFDRLIFFENTGDAQFYNLVWTDDNYQNLDTGNWFKFADVDRDGDLDLFAENPFGRIRYFRNDGGAANASFVLASDTLKDVNGVKIQLGGFSIPEWVDIDCDGQLELFFGDEVGGYIIFYEYVGQDAMDVPVFELISSQYQGLQILTGGGLAAASKAGSEAGLHGANSMSFADIDGDDDFDLIWGDFFAPSIIYLQNSGTCEEADFAITSEEFPLENPISTGGFNVPRFADIDGDNDPDMFIGVIGGAVSFTLDKAENLYYYENVGTETSFDFELRTKSFIRSIDTGQNSIVTMFDIDDDNDLDMFVANQEDVDAPGQLNSRISFFENEGSSTQPSFRLITSNLLNHDQSLEVNYSPFFIDYDGDGDYDILTGKWDGKLSYYVNTGSNQFELEETNFGAIDVGNNSAPVFIDIDDDGDLDLIIGEKSGNLNFYQNTGSDEAPVYEFITNDYFGIDVGDYSHPAFLDFDSDGDQDMFLGSDTNGVLFYRNQGDATSADFVLDLSLDLPRDQYTNPNMVDMNGDGNLDYISGNTGGGVIYYLNTSSGVGIGDGDDSGRSLPGGFELLPNYPNPFNPSTVIRYSLMVNSSVTLDIYNLAGQRIRQLAGGSGVSAAIQAAGIYEAAWDGRDEAGNEVASGVYFYRMTVRSGTRDPQSAVAQTRKMLLTR